METKSQFMPILGDQYTITVTITNETPMEVLEAIAILYEQIECHKRNGLVPQNT